MSGIKYLLSINFIFGMLKPATALRHGLELLSLDTALQALMRDVHGVA